MPRLYQRTARQDIWETGKRSEAANKQGYILDRSKPNVNARGTVRDELLVKKGEKYYTWHPKGRDWQYSTKAPDLRSAWAIELDDFMTREASIGAPEDFDGSYDEWETEKDQLVSDLEERISEMDESYSNMPDSLQTEEHILKERMQELQDIIDRI